jgi:flagellar biosynthesis/type III secretory pathway protein FliH
MLLKGNQTRSAGTRWIDPAPAEDAVAAPLDRQRVLQAQQVFKRRITSLKNQLEENRHKQEELQAGIRERMNEAREEGYEAGLSAGRREAEAELAAAMDLIGQMEKAFRRESLRLTESIESELVELAAWMASQVLADELRLGSERLERSVSALIERFQDQTELRFHLHPRDRAAFMELGKAKELVAGFKGRIDWIASADVPPGSCRLQLPDGLVETAPAEMIRHLKKELIAASQRSAQNEGQDR